VIGLRVLRQQAGHHRDADAGAMLRDMVEEEVPSVRARAAVWPSSWTQAQEAGRIGQAARRLTTPLPIDLIAKLGVVGFTTMTAGRPNGMSASDDHHGRIVIPAPALLPFCR